MTKRGTKKTSKRTKADERAPYGQVYLHRGRYIRGRLTGGAWRGVVWGTPSEGALAYCQPRKSPDEAFAEMKIDAAGLGVKDLRPWHGSTT